MTVPTAPSSLPTSAGSCCRVSSEAFLTMVEEIGRVRAATGRPWTQPAPLTLPSNWTCSAGVLHDVVLDVVLGVDGDTPLHVAVAADVARAERTSTAPSACSDQGEHGERARAVTVLRGGRIFTGSPDKPWAEAVATVGRRIVAVGTNGDVDQWVGAGTEVVELAGHLVIPGFNDAHMHHTPDPLGVRLPLDPYEDPDLTQLQARLEEAAAATPAGTWICGTLGVGLTVDQRLNRVFLDTHAPQHPVILLGMSNHTNVVNTRAMHAFGIGETDADPLGGSYGRVAGTAVLDGRVNEYASWVPQRTFADMVTREQGAASIRNLAADCLRFGITTLQNMSWTSVDRYFEMAVAAEVPVRLRIIRFPATGTTGRETEHGTRSSRDGLVSVNGTKWILDGTFVERGAAHQGYYHDDRSTAGTENFPREDVAVMMAESAAFDEQLLLHAIGTRAVATVISALDQNPGVARHVRLRLEHGDGATPEQLARLAQHGVTVVQNPCHFLFADLYALRYGPDHDYTSYRSLFEAGLATGSGSDGPLNPYLGLLGAVTEPTRPEEAVSLETAVRAYTHGSAWAQGLERELGRIEPGYLADLAVLSQDIFTVTPEELMTTTSELTMVDGAICYRTGAI